MKQFKAESQRLLDLMINSIYTNKDIFLRELISNASDAEDKLYYNSLTDKKVNIAKEDFKIDIKINKDEKTISVIDNGIGMNKEELENNLGTICESGSLLFKKEKEKREDIDIIGQFGVGFYSAFMVSKKITVETLKYQGEESFIWESTGKEGYEIKKGNKKEFGTCITLYLKDNNEEENYEDYLDEEKIKSIIKKYSNYIVYPIYINEEKEAVNSMIPIWKKDIKDVKEEEYDNFYTDTYYDYSKPLHVFRNKVEGKCSYTSLLFIPSHTPYDFYQRDYEKGLALYSNGVLISEKCSILLPDYFNFVKGLVDSEDVSLNISREILQEDKQVALIQKSIESKIKKELESLLKDDREKYIEFFKNFGTQLKFGIYNDYGLHKDDLKDLVLFYSSKKKELITLKEYINEMVSDQDKVYYASGETVEKIDNLPQVDSFKDKGYDILYLTDYVDEFAIEMLREYDGKEFINITNINRETDNDEEEAEYNNSNKDFLAYIKEKLDSEVSEVKFTNNLKNHAVCLSTKGHVSTEMEKIINAMPTDEHIKAETILEINKNHPIAQKLIGLYETDKEELTKYVKVLYNDARLISGMAIDNPSEMSNLICELLSK